MAGKILKTYWGETPAEQLQPQGHPGGGPNWFSPVPCEPCACGSMAHSGCSVTAFNRDAFLAVMDPDLVRYED